jgi:GGDEF domain-containing protein
MNIVGYEFQVIFCALILLSLAAVALIVDYLKGMNEKLRERQIDLEARHETMVQRVEEDNTKLLRALAEQSKAFRDMTRQSIVVTTKPAENALPEISLQPVAEIPAAPQSEPVLTEAGPVAVAEPEPVMETPAPAEETLPANVIRIRLKSNNPEPAAHQEPIANPAEPDFEKFLEELVSEFDAAPQSDSDLGALSSKLEEFSDRLELPAGAHPPAVLNQLLERKELLTGLVISVGINEYMKLEEIHGVAAAGELLNTVDSLMMDLVGDTGFCSRRSDDEFVVVFPRLTGAPAQQRLSEFAEKLWDYQLQTLGTFSVVFSWGASEAQHQLFGDVLSTAYENMIETRGTRKNASSDPGHKHRATA